MKIGVKKSESWSKITKESWKTDVIEQKFLKIFKNLVKKIDEKLRENVKKRWKLNRNLPNIVKNDKNMQKINTKIIK